MSTIGLEELVSAGECQTVLVASICFEWGMWDLFVTTALTALHVSAVVIDSRGMLKHFVYDSTTVCRLRPVSTNSQGFLSLFMISCYGDIGP